MNYVLAYSRIHNLSVEGIDKCWDKPKSKKDIIEALEVVRNITASFDFEDNLSEGEEFQRCCVNIFKILFKDIECFFKIFPFSLQRIYKSETKCCRNIIRVFMLTDKFENFDNKRESDILRPLVFQNKYFLYKPDEVWVSLRKDDPVEFEFKLWDTKTVGETVCHFHKPFKNWQEINL